MPFLTFPVWRTQATRPVLVADNEVGMPVAVEIRHHRDDHLQMEADFPVFVRKRPSRGEAGLRAGADVLEPSESIDEFAADQVRIAVAVEIGDTRIGRPVNVDRGAAASTLPRLTYPLPVFSSR